MPPGIRRPASPSARTASWDEVTVAPVVLVTGSELLLAERAVDRLIAQARTAEPSLEVTRIEAAGYQPGQLRVATSPSLFDEARVVVVEGLQSATEVALAEVAAQLLEPSEDVVLILQHGGGVRGKKTLDAIRAAGAVLVQCDPIKRDADKVAFAAAELARAGRKAEPAALRALVEACGNDLRDLAAACSQLVADTSGRVTAEMVSQYHGGRVEATGFRVADAAVDGRSGDAVALLRHALATGSDPVPVVAALAAKLRTLAKVAAARGRGIDPVRDLGLAPWQVDRARKDLVGWTPEALAEAISAVAQADAEVKGAGRDPVFAVERAVLRVAAAAS
ncbi:DNA polymerase III subunit delta [Actinotalea sp. K2]|uniref:DNA polymerase III subunit delta n=1 Tax=Actinotalea sp. K2 TaxID=2939438 RepID=UPI002016D69C|nr:DNA polymerase III subunit delta [Actinotalea sp. K2]MCL3860580.1 DNA polymerase III subunit delta [Actinotalea sp. K2]